MVHTLSILALLASGCLSMPVADATQPQPPGVEESDTLTVGKILDKYIQSAREGNKADLREARLAFGELFHADRPPTTDEKKLILSRAAEITGSDDWWNDPAVDLVLLLQAYTVPGDLPLLREAFPKLQPHAKCATLMCMTAIDEKTAVQTFLDLASAASKANELPMLMLGDYAESDTALPILVPAILDLTRHDDQPAYEVFHLFLGLLQDDRLTDETKAKTMSAAQAAIERIVPRVLQYEKDTPLALRTEEQQEDHDDLCALAGVILDVVSHADAATIERIARPALAVKSTNIRMWASIALLTADKAVPAEVLHSIADDIAERERFARILYSRGFEESFPEKFRNNADAAAANMYQWLMHPNELGQAPAAFEFAKRFEYTEDGQKIEYFVYRFKAKPTQDEPEPAWLMGVCGSYVVGTFDREGGAHTFSRFQPWDPELLEQEVKEVRKLIDAAWEDKLNPTSRRKPKW